MRTALRVVGFIASIVGVFCEISNHNQRAAAWAFVAACWAGSYLIQTHMEIK